MSSAAVIVEYSVAILSFVQMEIKGHGWNLLFPNNENGQLRWSSSLHKGITDDVKHVGRKRPVYISNPGVMVLDPRTSTVYVTQPREFRIVMLKFRQKSVKLRNGYLHSNLFKPLHMPLTISGSRMFIGSGKKLFSKIIDDDSPLRLRYIGRSTYHILDTLDLGNGTFIFIQAGDQGQQISLVNLISNNETIICSRSQCSLSNMTCVIVFNSSSLLFAGIGGMTFLKTRHKGK